MMHLVNRLRFEIECSGEEQAFEVEQKFTRGGHEIIAGIIDKVCSKYTAENEWVRIDKLELNLGKFDLVSFEREFSNAFVRKFESIIAGSLSGISNETLAASKAGSDLEALEYFLLKGHLPWWCDDKTLDMDKICRSVFDNRSSEILNFFRENLKNNSVWNRASFQLKREFLSVLVQSFVELSYALEILELILKKISNELILIEDHERVNLTGFLQQTMEKTVKIVVLNASLIFAAGKDIQKIRSIIAEKVLEDINAFNNESGLLENIEDIFNQVKEKIIKSETGGEPGTSLSSKRIKDADFIDIESEKIDTVINEHALVSGEDENEKLIVRHAGIILAAPFLNVFFSKLGLLKENSWINMSAQFKGIFLLKYLSSGKTKSFEYQLILEKLLCGVALEASVPSEIILSENEMEESELLLRSIIEHWKIIKNTSINGIRETFFNRDGIITKKENSWLLQIERKTVDVLLEKIPWGFSTIRLPWNEYLILTEW